LAAAAAALPRGRTLPEPVLRRRHRALLAFLWLHVPALAACGLLDGQRQPRTLELVGLIAALALGASGVRSSVRLASTLVAIGLVTSSATLVYVSGGLIEAHFHFFIVIALLSLYEDWIPFGIAIGLVFAYHGILGPLDSANVYDHADGQSHPWRWAAIHTGFLAMAAAAGVFAWSASERVRSQVLVVHRRARDADRRFKTMFDGATHGMALVSLQAQTFGRFIQVNPALCAITGYSERQLLARDVDSITYQQERARDLELMQTLVGGETASVEIEKRLVRADGSSVWVQGNASAVRDGAGRPLYAVAEVQDVTERRQHHAEHELLSAIVASSDDAIISKTLDGVITSWNPGAEKLYGFGADEAVGAHISDLIIPGHLAGDDFGIIRKVTAGESVRHYETERRHQDASVLDVSLTASPIRNARAEIVGVSVIARDISDRKRREMTMLRDGEDYSWARRIRRALDEDRFALYVQPVVDLRSGQATRAEVLLRMLGDRGPSDVISPGEFLGVAERFDLIGELDRWVLRNVMPLLDGTRAIEVNLSGASIRDFELTDMIESLLTENGVDPTKLTVEVTETAAVQDVQAAGLFAERMHAMGCGLALDDFGTGYGSFTYLKHMSIEFIKIDMQFIRDLVQSEPDQQVVRSMVHIARDFGVRTIAEGVENAETLELLKRYGVDFAQGYYLGRPEPASASRHVVSEARPGAQIQLP
jgi:PAS domain S-box-containing protein